MKTQSIRILDVFLIGPLMILAGMNKKPKPALQKSMIALGFLTIIYNAKNFLKHEKNTQEN